MYTYNDAADEHLDSRCAKQVENRANEMTNTLREIDVANPHEQVVD